MSIPCDKGPILSEIREDVKQIHTVVTTIATQNERIVMLENKADDYEGRLRRLEPLKMLYWVGGIGTPVLLGWLVQG